MSDKEPEYPVAADVYLAPTESHSTNSPHGSLTVSHGLRL